MRLAIDRGGLVGLVALAAYCVLASPFVVDGDNAELATLAHTGGLAHPTGYPAYVLWLRLWSWLPGSPAHAAAFATALLGAAALVVLVNACRAWGARPAAATVCAAVVGGAPIVLRIATEAEVFAMNDLVAALVLWLAARHGPARGMWRGFLLGLVAGFGLADHVTCALLAPVGVLGVVRAVREQKLAAPLALAGLVLGLSPYAYAFVAPDTPMSWGGVHDLGGLFGLVTRRDYGGALAFAPTAQDVSPWSQLGAFASTLGRAWLPVLVLGLLAVGRGRAPAAGQPAGDPRGDSAGDPPRETRVAWAMLALAWLLAGPLLVSRFDLPAEGIGLAVCRRFHALPLVLLAVPIAVAIGAVPMRGPRAGGLLAAALALPAALALSLPGLGRVHTAAVERYAENVLGEMPPHAVLVLGEDYSYAGTQYVQWALGQNQDVIVIDSGLLCFPWYRDRLARRGVPMPPAQPTVASLVAAASAVGLHVFVDLKQKDVIAKLATYPYGAVIAVGPPPAIDDLVQRNLDLIDRFRMDYAPPGPDDEYASVIHRHYAAMRELIAHALDQAGRHEEAAELRQTAEHPPVYKLVPVDGSGNDLPQ